MGRAARSRMPRATLGSISSSRCQTTCATAPFRDDPTHKIGFSQTSNNAGEPSRNPDATRSQGRRSKPSGGARRDRTDDLLLAKQALSQLSYGPVSEIGFQRSEIGDPDARSPIADFLELVGLGRFELPTSRLSSARSNQLSYKPVPGVSNQKPAIRKAHVGV